MTARLRTHHMVLIGLGSAFAAITACSAPEVARETDSKKTTQASSVAVDILAANGTSLGSCSGTLIAPKLVLTAGHCIVGANHWKVSNSAGTSEASVASTPWKNFRSDLSHPEHSDVGLILLDDAIKLDSYPQIATAKAKDGAKGVRFHRESSSAKEAIATNTKIKSGADEGFRLNYLLDVAEGEWLDTGGAVLDSSGKIVGVISGKGKQSDLLHVARVDGFATWAKSAVSCSNGLTTRTWGSGNKQNGGGGYGGTPSTSSGGGGWGGWGGGGDGWGSSSGGYGGGGGKGSGGGGMMDGGATVPGSSGNGGGGSSGSSGTTGGGSSGDGNPGNNPGDGTSSSGGAGGDDDASNTCPGIPTCAGGDCGAGSNGNNGGTGSDGSSSGNNGSSSGSDGSSSGSSGASSSGSSGSSGTGASSGTPGSSSGSSGTTGSSGGGGGASSGGPGGDGEPCSGSADNPEVCPPAPDSASCNGPSCGGCGGGSNCSDSNIDYGACPSCTNGGSSGPIVK